jgi:hypothetical protein
LLGLECHECCSCASEFQNEGLTPWAQRGSCKSEFNQGTRCSYAEYLNFLRFSLEDVGRRWKTSLEDVDTSHAFPWKTLINNKGCHLPTSNFKLTSSKEMRGRCQRLPRTSSNVFQRLPGKTKENDTSQSCHTWGLGLTVLGLFGRPWRRARLWTALYIDYAQVTQRFEAARGTPPLRCNKLRLATKL